MNEPDWADEIVKDLRDDEDELLPFVVMRSVAAALRSAVESRDKEIAELKSVIIEANNSLFGSQSFFLKLSADSTVPVKYHLAHAIENLKALAGKRYARIKELEGQHKGLVLQNAMLRERPDLPADRIPAAMAYERRVKELEEWIARYKSDREYVLGWNDGFEHASLDRRVKELEEALRPFADAVFNDNGDMAISNVVELEAYLKAYFTLKKEQP